MSLISIVSTDRLCNLSFYFFDSEFGSKLFNVLFCSAESKQCTLTFAIWKYVFYLCCTVFMEFLGMVLARGGHHGHHVLGDVGIIAATR